MTGKFGGMKSVRGTMGKIALRKDGKLYIADVKNFSGHYEDVRDAFYQLSENDIEINVESLGLNLKSKGHTFTSLTVTVEKSQ